MSALLFTNRWVMTNLHKNSWLVHLYAWTVVSPTVSFLLPVACFEPGEDYPFVLDKAMIKQSQVSNENAINTWVTSHSRSICIGRNVMFKTKPLQFDVLQTEYFQVYLQKDLQEFPTAMDSTKSEEVGLDHFSYSRLIRYNFQ